MNDELGASEPLEETGASGPELAVLVALGKTDEDSSSLEELAALVRTAGADPVARVIQNLDHPKAGTYVGKGKLDELEALALSLGADLVVFDAELTPVQHRTLVDRLPCKVLDRTELILDIFAQRARSLEGKLQVELAQLQYTLPRLTGRGKMMSRIGGGMRGSGPIGTRGPGRMKLEVDRARIQHRMHRMRKELGEVARRRQVSRSARQEAGLPAASLVGYTNAGKSSLLNALAGGEEVSVRDRLFETLDTTTRRVTISPGRDAAVSDTVGFVRHLPHQLVAAFHATLEEALQADLLVQVIDASDSDHEKQREATWEVLRDLGALQTPMIHAFNKVDLVADRATLERTMSSLPNALAISATTGEGLDELRDLMNALLVEGFAPVTLEIPYDALHLLNLRSEEGRVLSYQYEAERVVADAELGPAALSRLRKYIVAS